MCRCIEWQYAIICRGCGGGPPTQRGARGAVPPRMCQHAQRGGRAGQRSPASRCNAASRKDNEVSTQVAIRDLFCKRRRAMLQYGTPDWARPRLARLTPWGFCVGQLVLKRIGADHFQTLAQPQHAGLCSGVHLGMAGCSLLSIWFCYPQKGARATKLNGQCCPTLNFLPLLICRSDLGGMNQCPKS